MTKAKRKQSASLTTANGVAKAAKRQDRKESNDTELPFASRKVATFTEDPTEEQEKKQSEGASAIDDPVRMYLMQMGEIPMLTRQEEVNAARQIDHWRRRFRMSLLASDFVLQGAVNLLQKVKDRELRLDRTIEVSVTDTSEKKRIMSRLGPNLKTLRQLLVLNHRDYRLAIAKSRPQKERIAAWQRLIRRRFRAVRLVEELNLRTQKLFPLMEKVHEVSRRMNTLKAQIAMGGGECAGGRTVNELRSELHYLCGSHLKAQQLSHIALNARKNIAGNMTQPNATCRLATYGWSFRLPRSIVTGVFRFWTSSKRATLV